MCPDLIKMAPKSKLRTFFLFLDVMFFFLFGQVRENLSKFWRIWAKMVLDICFDF